MPEPDVTGRLARYMAGAWERSLAPHVAREARHRILDTLAAMVSGSRLKPGAMAIRYAQAQGGVAEATVVATDIMTSAVNAALVNGMFAHADETDDFEPVTKAHPGSAIVPAALAMAEREARSGAELVAAVALGYDVCCRFLLALGPDLVRASHRSAEGTSSTLGAVAAAASLARLDEAGMRYALSYAAQQVSGVWSWVRDAEHVEKAFDFSGMGARNGVTAAIMVKLGFTGVWDVLDGEHNALLALSSDPRPEEMVAGLGSRFFVTETAIKPYSVGYPIQAPLDAFLTLHRAHGLSEGNVERIVVRLPEDGARIVNDRSMPTSTASTSSPWRWSTAASRSRTATRTSGWRTGGVRAAKARIQLIADRELMDPAAPRSGRVEVTLRDGRTVSHFTRHAPGTKENPLDTKGVSEKARLLMTPVLGEERTGGDHRADRCARSALRCARVATAAGAVELGPSNAILVDAGEGSGHPCWNCARRPSPIQGRCNSAYGCMPRLSTAGSSSWGMACTARPRPGRRSGAKAQAMLSPSVPVSRASSRATASWAAAPAHLRNTR
jgi:2-methylcitrate dehydratase PrpD